MTMPPALFSVPAPEPLEGAALEDAARVEMLRALGWSVAMNTPSWRTVVFRGSPIRFMLPKVPEGVIDRIAHLDENAFAKDDIGLAALKLAEDLKTALPEGAAPETMAPTRRFPPSRDAMSTWSRRAALTAMGPAAVPLLVVSGYLMPDDVPFFEETFPEGLEEQRRGASAALTALGDAGRRAGHANVIPPWLDEQFWTLMGEPRDTQQYQGMYEEEKKQQQPNNPPQQQGDSKIAEQFRPTPSPGSVA